MENLGLSLPGYGGGIIYDNPFMFGNTIVSPYIIPGVGGGTSSYTPPGYGYSPPYGGYGGLGYPGWGYSSWGSPPFGRYNGFGYSNWNGPAYGGYNPGWGSPPYGSYGHGWGYSGWGNWY